VYEALSLGQRSAEWGVGRRFVPGFGDVYHGLAPDWTWNGARRGSQSVTSVSDESPEIGERAEHLVGPERGRAIAA